MRYFNNDGVVFGYDETNPNDDLYIAAALNAGWVEVTGSWPPPPTLDESKAIKLAEINTACQIALATIIAPYPPSEVHTWDQQSAEAVAFTADNTVPSPLLTAIAEASTKSVADLAASILSLSAAYKAASGAAIGKRQALTAQITAAETVEAVQAIVW
jgi:hypothetical protein